MANVIMEGEKKDEEKMVLKEHENLENNHADTTADGGATPVGDFSIGRDDSTVQFVNGKGDHGVYMGENGAEEFVCLKKEDLVKYANDPYWVKVRIVLLVIFALAWIAMLVAAIVIVVLAPKCPPRKDLDWWQKSVVYHIHPQSFLDTNGDGFGDVKGIHKKIDYLRDQLHVGTVCIGPMNPSPNFNYGYNINNYNIICPGHYGSMADFEELIVALHRKGIRLLLDFIPNHTSRKHPWFVNSSRADGASLKHGDWYIWQSGREVNGTLLPPNNWKSVYGGSAWTYNPNRKQFYYHTFSEDEPDLNLRNKAVVAELDASLKGWMKLGVDGFRFYGVQYLVEPENITNSTPASMDEETSSVLEQSFQSESYMLVYHWRELLDEYSTEDSKSKTMHLSRVMVAEVNGPANLTARFMQNGDEKGAHVATNVALTKVTSGCDANCVSKLITDWTQSTSAADIWSNWQIGNVDVSRVATRMNDRRLVNALNMMLLTLPGTPFVYYGEELGMKDVNLSLANCMNKSIVENFCRLAQRSPMQWSGEQNAGFSDGSKKPWMNITDDYHSVNVEAQLAHGAGVSTLSVFSKVAKLREEPSFQWGEFHPTVIGTNVFGYIRQAEGFDGYLVAINFGQHSSTVNFGTGFQKFDLLPEKATVAMSTGNFEGPGRNEAFQENVEIELNGGVYLSPGEGVLLRFTPKAA